MEDSKQTIVLFGKRVYFGVPEAGRHEGLGLQRDHANPARYITIDYWQSEAAYTSFRSEYAQEFADLDARCVAWTTSEREMGRFTTLA
jgi:hypothetical protein